MGDINFEWRPEFDLGHVEMDETHHEFVECVQALLTCDDSQVGASLARFEDHARRHFAEEDRWMRTGDYPSAGCHVDEHAAVLRSVVQVRELAETGRVDVARALAKELARWFPEHAQVMDQGLARWLAQRQFGGAPMVIVRRRPAAAVLSN
jgi:hemerythrin-like metal-binding protein